MSRGGTVTLRLILENLGHNEPEAGKAAAFVAIVGEIFPTEQDDSALSAGYNFGNALLGGTAPMVGTPLIAITGLKIAPALYLVGASLIVIPLLFRIRETAG